MRMAVSGPLAVKGSVAVSVLFFPGVSEVAAGVWVVDEPGVAVEEDAEVVPPLPHAASKRSTARAETIPIVENIFLLRTVHPI